MKKYIYLIFAALSALLLLSACRREQPVEVKKPALKVVSSNVVFGVEGGEGTIVVEADGTVSVTSERPWVQTSVNGKTITVTVSELNPSPQSRYSRLTIQAGSEKTYVTVHQFGEIFDGMKMEDVTVASAGTTMRYGFKANMTVNVTADQPWVHCEMDEENEGVLIVTVDKHEGFGYRFANVSFTAGSNTGSMKITQEPTYGAVSGWTVEDTDGRFVFPDQIDVIEVTPSSDMATAPYYWGVLDPSELAGKDIPAFIRELAASTKEAVDAGEITLCKGADSDELKNLPSTAKAIIIVFDDQNYPTGQYAVIDVAVPDRGPKKQLVDGWEISHDGGTFVAPDQVDVFTITPKAGYEDVKYIATVVSKELVTDIEDYAFTTFAMAEREAILAKVASGELPSFDAGLSTGTTELSCKNLTGEVYVFVVAFSDNQFYTGDYSYEEFAISDAKRSFWIGTWTLTNTAGDSYTCIIKEKDDDSGYLTMSCNGLYTGTGAKLVAMNWVDLRYNEDGTLTLFGQEHKEMEVDYNATYGNVYPGLYGYFTRDGKVYYRTAVPYDIFDLTFGEAGTAVIGTIHPVPDDTILFESIAMRYWSSVKGSRFYFTSNKTITLDGLKLTKQ